MYDTVLYYTKTNIYGSSSEELKLTLADEKTEI